MTTDIAERPRQQAQQPLSLHVMGGLLALDVALRPLLDQRRRDPKTEAVHDAVRDLRAVIGRYILVDKLLGRHIFDADPAEVLRTLLIAARQAGVGWDVIAQAVTTLQDEGHP